MNNAFMSTLPLLMMTLNWGMTNVLPFSHPDALFLCRPGDIHQMLRNSWQVSPIELRFNHYPVDV